MSFITAFDKIKEVLVKADFKVEDGIPTEADRIPKNTIYMGSPATEAFEYATLQPMNPTTTFAEITLVTAVHREERKGGTLLGLAAERVKKIRETIEPENDPSNGAFKNDGDKGFAAYMTTATYDYESGSPIASAIMTVRIEAYDK